MANQATSNIIQLEDGWNNVLKKGVSFIIALVASLLERHRWGRYEWI